MAEKRHGPAEFDPWRLIQDRLPDSDPDLSETACSAASADRRSSSSCRLAPGALGRGVDDLGPQDPGDEDEDGDGHGDGLVDPKLRHYEACRQNGMGRAVALALLGDGVAGTAPCAGSALRRPGHVPARLEGLLREVNRPRRAWGAGVLLWSLVFFLFCFGCCCCSCLLLLLVLLVASTLGYGRWGLVT